MKLAQKNVGLSLLKKLLKSPWLIGLSGVVLVLIALIARTASPEVSSSPQVTTTLRATGSPEARPTLPAPTPSPTHLAFDHPRLFFTSDDVPSLQAVSETSHREIWMPIREYVDSELGFVPPASSPDEDDSEYRDYGNRLIATAFACVITENPDDCDLAKTQLLVYATWEQWGSEGSRDLGLAHMLLGNALAYDWLHPLLTDAERQRVRDSLAIHTQEMYEASAGPREEAWFNWWRRSYMQNHYWTNNSALGMAALSLFGEDERAQIWVDYAQTQMSIAAAFMQGIGDGTWHEGINYQNYQLTMSMPFFVNLERVVGADIFPDEYLQNYVYWRIYNDVPQRSDQYLLAYGDYDPASGDGYRSQNLLRLIASRYDDGRAEWAAQRVIAANGRFATIAAAPWYVFEFLYYDPTLAPLPPSDLDTARVFPDLEAVIWRTGWGDDALSFALKTGAYGGRFASDTFINEQPPWDGPCEETGCQLNIGHDHDDANSFAIYRAGRWLAPEATGTGNYATAYHNTILIDEQGQVRPSEDTWRQPEAFRGIEGSLEAVVNATNYNFVAADATRRYSQIALLQDFTRYVVFVRPAFFVMLDNLASGSEHVYEWVSHFGQGVAVEDNWVRGEAGEGDILGVAVISPQAFEATTGDDGRPFVRVRTAPRYNVRFINVLYPTDETSWNSRPTVTLLEDNGEAVAIRVETNDGSERISDILISYVWPLSVTSVGPYEFDGRVAVVTRQSDSLVGLFVYEGTHLEDRRSRRLLVERSDGHGVLEVMYRDAEAAITGDGLTDVTLYAPNVTEVQVNESQSSYLQLGDYIYLR